MNCATICYRENDTGIPFLYFFAENILDPRGKGSMKYPPSILPFVSLSGVFLRNRYQDFSDFLHEGRVSSNLKSEGDRFFANNLNLRFLDQKGPEWAKQSFSNFMKNPLTYFFYFLHKVTAI